MYNRMVIYMDKKYLITLIAFALISAVSFTAIFGTVPKMNVNDTNRMELENKIRADEKTGITKTDEFFSVSYNGVPQVDIEKYTLKVDGLVENPIKLSYNDLKNLSQKEEESTLTCIALISAKGVWEGIPLKDLLNMVKVKNGATYIIFYAVDGYSSAIPLENALKDNVILAMKLNGEILTPKHGFPLRLVYPGYYGYKWVKWINHIKVINYEYRGYWESRGYSNEAKIKKP